VWIGRTVLCQRGVETGTRLMKLGADDIGNLRIHFGCWDETFMDGSVSANSTPHNQVLGDRLTSSNLSVQDFFGHRQCLPVIVRSLLGMERHNVTNLEFVLQL
jgi:hypothetical protein